MGLLVKGAIGSLSIKAIMDLYGSFAEVDHWFVVHYLDSPGNSQSTTQPQPALEAI
jgi:hypothetical protein